MKPVAFRYERPESVEEAAAVLAEHGDEAKVLAGGQSLVPALNMRVARPSVIVDVNRLPLGDVSRENGSWRVGALVRQADRRLLDHPLLAEAIPYVGHFATRNRGTVAGSLAHADASAELPLCLTLLGGSVVTSAGREVSAGELFVTHWTTSLAPTELVVESRWPAAGLGAGFAFCELAQRHGDFALCAAAAVARGDELRVAVGAVVERPTVLEVDPDAPGESAAAQVEPYGNLHASAAYLRNLVRVLVDRAAARARERSA
ncbi:MAG TPA: FAD binding domain-containing protein [Gaiellaceae bacterium]|nr:FAD binding domain-containing protein [Gaiellaceae bacterium]